ncbi:hypothetical protein ACIP4W_36795 [Streptomyces sp. NPDC088846]|uniref:hypothetical protein n=1 Tax=Streptomyces sp. NPDC088846 TaxID=3365908 RepID=UPI00380D7E3C
MLQSRVYSTAFHRSSVNFCPQSLQTGRRAHRLYGFSVPGIDYTDPVETDTSWPSPTN